MLGPDVGLYCLEVGKGASTAIVEPIPSRASGSFQATVVDVGERGVELSRWLRDNNVVRIPAILLTHNDADHVGSLTCLVESYKKRIGKLRFVFDRRKEPPFWIPSEKWLNNQWIQNWDMMGSPVFSKPQAGELMVGPDDGVGFRLYCTYPPKLLVLSFLAKLRMLWPFWGSIKSGTNQLSAILRLTSINHPQDTLALFGGDLDYKGWQYLVESKHDLRTQVLMVPHHGGPQRATKKFAASELARATQPSYALVSVGTNNKNKHPHDDLVAALRGINSYVICTQITQKCLRDGTPPNSLPNEALLRRTPLNGRLCSSGSACAGTIVVQFLDSGPRVRRLNSHQQAVNQLQANGHTPLCRS